MKRSLTAACLMCLFATPSFAQDTTTVQFMVAKGVVIHGTILGKARDIPVAYSADGTSMMSLGGQDVPGKWRVDGARFCTSNIANPTETCFDIPAGKKPGDSFTVTSPTMGETTITINK